MISVLYHLTFISQLAPPHSTVSQVLFIEGGSELSQREREKLFLFLTTNDTKKDIFNRHMFYLIKICKIS